MQPVSLPRFALQVQQPEARIPAQPPTRIPGAPVLPVAAGDPIVPAPGGPPVAGRLPASPPVAGAGGGGSSGGGGAPAPALPPLPPAPTVAAGDLTGQVRVSWPEGQGPAVAGARVQAFLSRGEVETVTDLEGRFTVAQPGGSGDLLVTAPGFATTLIAGWDGTSDLTLHLTTQDRPPPFFESLVRVSGQVAFEGGGPATGVTVLGSDGAGTSFGPFTTDDQGRYEGFAKSVAGPVAGGLAVWGYKTQTTGEVEALGLATDVAIGGASAPASVTLHAATGGVSLAARGPAGRRSAAVVAEAANGAAVVLRAWGPHEALDVCPFFEVAGGRLMVQVLVESDDGQARSAWRGEVAGPGELTADLIGFPGPPMAMPAGLVDGAPLRWAAAEGATAYRLATRRGGDAAPGWEAWTAVPGLTLRGVTGVAAETLEITALGGASQDLFQLASVDAPRRLRWPQESSGVRTSVRTISLPH